MSPDTYFLCQGTRLVYKLLLNYIYVNKLDNDDDDELFPSDNKKKPTVPSAPSIPVPNKDTTDTPPYHKVTT